MAKDTTRCLFQGPLTGTLRCSCTGSARIYTCFNATDNPTGLCSDYAKDDYPEGAIQGKDGKTGSQKWLLYPYRQKNLDAGHPIHEDWILTCCDCPFSKPEPPEVAVKRAEAATIARWLRQYEESDSLIAREALLAK